jgi:RimJ/RimL family protein N-acetyltransferase
MQKLTSEQYPVAKPLLAELAAFNLSVEAVLAGAMPGEVYVDDVDHPQVALAMTPEGEYLAGDPGLAASYAGLKEVIPLRAYLIVHPQGQGWQDVLSEIWVNPAARRHDRQHYLYHGEAGAAPTFHLNVPEGFELVPVDAALLARTSLINYEAVQGWVGSWGSPEYFYEHGFGFCLIKDNTIVSRCIADCVVGNASEIGISTVAGYRRMGLAAIVASAAIDYCLTHGIQSIGWHCLSSNAGSIAVAKKVGLAKERDYFALSAVLPTENATDMPAAAYADWAAHYERFTGEGAMYVYRAAAAWAMAGELEKAQAQLQALLELKWEGQPDWLEENWMFEAVRGTGEYAALLEFVKGNVKEDKDADE